jgi:hypothetical protein
LKVDFSEASSSFSFKIEDKLSLMKHNAGRISGILKDRRRFFSLEDDQLLRQLKDDPSSLSWSEKSDRMPDFNARQVCERWSNYLSPTLKTTSWTKEEDAELGQKWGIISLRMGNRSLPDIKNRFRSSSNGENSSKSPSRTL